MIIIKMLKMFSTCRIKMLQPRSILVLYYVSLVSSTDHRESAGFYPEGLGGISASLTHINHGQTNMCPHTIWLFTRLQHKEQECYIFITDVINTRCSELFLRVLIAQQKGLIRSINQWLLWDTGIQVKRHKKTESADWAANRDLSALLFTAASAKKKLWKK